MSDELSENPDDESTSDVAADSDRCPACGDTQYECDHFFASFDLLEPYQGELGLGLGGGALYDLAPVLGKVVDALVEFAMIEERESDAESVSPAQRQVHERVSRWITEVGWVSECAKTKREIIEEALEGGYRDDDEIRSLAQGSQVSRNLDWLTSLVFECGGVLRKVSQDFDRPMMSTEYEIWWVPGRCESLVAEMRSRLDALAGDLPPE